MAESSGESGRFSPEQRELLQRIITAELRRLWDEAASAGISADALADVIEQRRQAILSALTGTSDPSRPVGTDDVQNSSDNPVDDGRIGH